MDPENIEPATPIAGSPEVRAIVGEPAAVDAVPGTARRADISFADAVDAAEFG
jgi:hypothetical protein